ncbi:hypothetical protein E4T45_07934 [Aureobasidium sp. EXF-8846]|nr:hypothetical protein E4T45_07934 [Aureobasidium sp. EXF-8846]
MKIPTFFLRTNMRLWIFQALVAWFCIRSHYLPIPSLMRFALTSTLWTYVDDAKEILDSRFRFILPTEAAYFLPVALEAYLVGSSLRVMQGCWELYHTDVEDARKHHERAHKHEPSFFLQLVGCMQVVDFWEKNTEICGANPSVVQCIAEYGGSVTKDDKTGRPMALEASEEVAGGSDIEAAAAS